MPVISAFRGAGGDVGTMRSQGTEKRGDGSSTLQNHLFSAPTVQIPRFEKGALFATGKMPVLLPYAGVFLSVFFASRNAVFVGTPFSPGLRLFSPLPFAMRFLFAWMFE